MHNIASMTFDVNPSSYYGGEELTLDQSRTNTPLMNNAHAISYDVRTQVWRYSFL